MRFALPIAGLLSCVLAGCSGTAKNVMPNTLGLTLVASTVSLAPNITSTAVQMVLTRSATETNSVTISVSGAPAGVAVSLVQPAFGTYGSITIATTVATIPGSYPLTLTASDGTVSATSTLTLTALATDAVTIAPFSPSLLVRQDATPASAGFTVSRSYGNSNAITVAASGLPTGLTATITQPGTGTSGSVSFATSSTPAAAGTYNVTLTASDGTASSTTTLPVSIGIIATIANAVDTSHGIGGHFTEFMSTGFQPSSYNNGFFPEFPSTSTLAALDAQHIRIQTSQNTLPWLTNSGTPQASDWNFVPMDQTVQPVLSVGDNSPTFQIETAPLFLCDSNGNFVFNSANLTLFTSYAQNLVRYYNTGGFDWGGKHFQSASSHHIQWWAIFNEPNLHNLTAAQYVQLYNTVVPAMLTVDPTLKFVALELSDYTSQPQLYLPTLVQAAASGGIAAQINAISTHFYGSCNQTTSDAATFAKVPQFATDVTYFRTELATRSDLATVPVWVTENNVNADFEGPNGYSSCNPTQLFVNDPRGSSGFFTSWRPYVFSQLGKAGNAALYHFLYEGSSQYGEVNNQTAATSLAYWTDYWLEHVFPSDSTSSGGSILLTSTTEATPSVEILAVRNADSSVSLMVSGIASASSSDNNGNGAPRTVLINLAALGSFTSGTQIVLNGSTLATTGPTPSAFTPTSTMTVTLSGYGTNFFVLKP